MIDIIGIAAVSTVADMIKYDKNMTQANERNLKSLHKLGESSFQRQEQEKKTRNAVVRCLKRKKALVETSIKDFVELYSKIGKIRFEESDGLKEIELIKQEQTDVQELAQTVICCANIKDSSSKLEIVAAVALGNIPMAAARSLRRDSENQLMAARVIKKRRKYFLHRMSR